jgi:hypothetical protein
MADVIVAACFIAGATEGVLRRVRLPTANTAVIDGMRDDMPDILYQSDREYNAPVRGQGFLYQY